MKSTTSMKEKSQSRHSKEKEAVRRVWNPELVGGGRTKGHSFEGEGEKIRDPRMLRRKDQ